MGRRFRRRRHPETASHSEAIFWVAAFRLKHHPEKWLPKTTRPRPSAIQPSTTCRSNWGSLPPNKRCRERTATRPFTAPYSCKAFERYSSYAPSSRSSHSLRSSPPAYPLSEPSAATTRWHGTIIEMGLRATAAPTAREDTTGSSFPGTRCRAAIRWAISPYVATSPRGIESSSNQTSR